MIKFKDYIKESLAIKSINLKNISKEFYHGSTVDSFGIHELEVQKNSAIWFTDNENAAKSFSREKLNINPIQIIYRAKLTCKNTANITKEVYTYIEKGNYSPENIMNLYIPTLKRKGFDSWFSGLTHWGSIKYNDVAVFNDDCFEVTGYKLKIKNKWTEFFKDKFDAERILDGDDDE